MPYRSIRSMVSDKPMLTAPAETSVRDAARLMKQAAVGSVMVVHDGLLVGIFTERDALFRVLAEGRDASATRLDQVMTTKPQTIEASRPFGHALHMMYEGGFRHVPVVEDGRPIGMVSARDVLGPEVDDFEVELLQRQHIGEIL